MSTHGDLRPALRERAGALAEKLSAAWHAELLVKCWMSHDARWFMAVAKAHGMEAANRLNQEAARETGKTEAQRIIRALGLAPGRDVERSLLILQEALIALLGPGLLDYDLARTAENGFQVHVRRCFAHENVVRAGIAQDYDCGIFARVQGWLEGLGLAHEIDPPLGRCMKACGTECLHAITLSRPAA